MTLSHRVRRQEVGFTLLEALIAITIAALALGALARAVGQGAHSATQAALRQQAAIVAHAVLSSGTFAEDFLAEPQGSAPPWSWRVHVTPQTLPLADAAGHEAVRTISAAQLTIAVYADGTVAPLFELTAWKPYRNVP